jgi:hypothetical protein
MTAGKLAAVKPAATTNTNFYSCPINKATSSVLEVCNQSASASSYRVALRDYDQILTLDDTDYSLKKGNVISNYTIGISPGIATDQSDPGDIITIEDNKGTFKYHDVFKPTTTITYPVKVASLGTIAIDDTTLVGTFEPGDTITGAITGLTAIVYAVDISGLTVNIAPISQSATSFYINNVTGIAASDLIHTDGEIVSVGSVTGYQVTVTRAQVGTTATAHPAGSSFTALRSTATTTTINEGATFSSTDNTLTVTSSTSLTIGDYIRIGNEFLTIGGITGNDLSVIRGQFGTTPTTHADGATVTLFDEVATGFSQFFDLTEEVDNGAGATVDLSITSGPLGALNPSDKFVYDFGGGAFEFTNDIPVDLGRIIRFTQVDASNTGNTLRFSVTPDGTNNSGIQYNTGVTVNGTAGSSGAYTEINLTPSNLIGGISQLYIYTPGTPLISNNGYLDIDLTPNYNTLYIYDLNGSITTGDSFVVNNVTYTVTAATSGAYGYVHGVSGSAVKVSLGVGSSAFASSNTFFDSPVVPGTDRRLATVSSISSINVEDYIFYDRAIDANVTHRNTGIVVGPGQSIMVYSTANTISYMLHGFEDVTTDFSPVYYYRQDPSQIN